MVVDDLEQEPMQVFHMFTASEAMACVDVVRILFRCQTSPVTGARSPDSCAARTARARPVDRVVRALPVTNCQ